MDKRQEARQDKAHTDPFNARFIFAAFKTGRFYGMIGYVPPNGFKKFFYREKTPHVMT